jgi:hypothetical protein
MASFGFVVMKESTLKLKFLFWKSSDQMHETLSRLVQI